MGIVSLVLILIFVVASTIALAKNKDIKFGVLYSLLTCSGIYIALFVGNLVYSGRSLQISPADVVFWIPSALIVFAVAWIAAIAIGLILVLIGRAIRKLAFRPPVVSAATEIKNETIAASETGNPFQPPGA